MSKSPITCHVLDISLGKPAAGVEVNIQKYHRGPANVDIFDPFGHGVTDADGRCTTLLPPKGSDEAKLQQKEVTAGVYKLAFKPGPYFEKTGRKCFYPWVEIPFEIENPDEHYHIPLLISPYSFTTYRGS
ncbi:transthyretin [Leucogyrophana mollusca]|uniref:Transthyretin n=1 Tax=Leucogyrophana mollusca TaxID=85980 RepID=A0ACB8BZ80_9AGAM|nr:transthyretin [Leucogyrophana mollusca]